MTWSSMTECLGMAQSCNRGGSDWALGNIHFPWWWSNTEAGFLARWLVPHGCQCSRDISPMFSLVNFNFWLKISSSWTRSSLKCPSKFYSFPLCGATDPKNKVTVSYRKADWMVCVPEAHKRSAAVLAPASLVLPIDQDGVQDPRTAPSCSVFGSIFLFCLFTSQCCPHIPNLALLLNVRVN